MVKNSFIFVLIFFSCFCVNAQPEGFKTVADEEVFREQLSQAAETTQTITSDFTQEKNLLVLSEKIISRGQFMFKKENKVRMEYQEPFNYLLVINQDKVMIKDDQKTNSFSAKNNKLFAIINNIIMDCVQGTALDNNDFSPEVFENDSQYLLILTPEKKNLKEFFSGIHIYLERQNCSVYQMNLLEPTGDNTVITFLNKEFNLPVPDAEFVVH